VFLVFVTLLLHRRTGVQRGRPLVVMPVGPPVRQHSDLQVDLQQRQEAFDTLFSSEWQCVSYRDADPVPACRCAWTIAFQTGTPQGEVGSQHLGADFVSVYVPTTPNPTSGFFLMLPRADVIELKMSVDEALTYVISMGAVAPAPQPAPARGQIAIVLFVEPASARPPES
jgi:uncharacterized membrane protein